MSHCCKNNALNGRFKPCLFEIGCFDQVVGPAYARQEPDQLFPDAATLDCGRQMLLAALQLAEAPNIIPNYTQIDLV